MAPRGDDEQLAQPLLADGANEVVVGVPPAALDDAAFEADVPADIEEGEVGKSCLVEESSPLTGVPPPNTVWRSIANLSKTILGSGIVALPLAYYRVGWVTGTLFFLSVGCLTSVSIYSLVHASEVTKQRSFSSVIGTLFGKKWTIFAQLVLFLDIIGTCIVYLLVMGHVTEGLIETVSGFNEDYWPTSIPFPYQTGVVLTVMIIFVLPAACVRRLDNLGGVSAIGVFSVFLFAVSLLIIAAAAFLDGSAHSIPMWPQWDMFGKDPLTMTIGLAAVVPVLLNANFCQVSVQPVHEFLRPRTVGTMMRVTATSLVFCNTLFLVVAISSCLAFGRDLHGDVLRNFTEKFMQPLIGKALAWTFSFTVLVGYFLSMWGSFTMMFWPLRQAVSEIIWGHIPDGAFRFYTLSVTLLTLIFAGTIFLTDVYTVFMLIGATTCTIIGFFYPGAILMHPRCQPKTLKAQRLQFSAACFQHLLGVILTVAGVFTAFFGEASG